MEEVAGFTTATTEELPGAVSVMDPFHLVRWPVTRSTSGVPESSKTCTVTAGAGVTRSPPHGGPCTPARRPAHRTPAAAP